MNPVKKDRILGGFLGHALGDALGAPFEFRYSYPLNRYTGKLELPILWKSRFGPIQQSVVGQTTDDSSMAISVLSVLLQDRTWTQDTVIKSYIDWANSGIKFLGRNTRALFYGIKRVSGYYDRLARVDRTSESNGSLMRAYPLLLLFEWLPEDQAWDFIFKDTSLSNPCLPNLEAIRVYLSIFRMIENETSPAQGIPILYNITTSPELKLAIQQAAAGQVRDVKAVGKGWIVHAVYASIQAWMQASNGNSFQNIINWVILLGGDTDTNGAIAGAVAGFYAGEAKMRTDPITAENIRILLTADTNLGSFPLDPKYSPNTGYQLLQTL